MIKFLDLQKITELHSEEYRKAVEGVIESGWFLQGEQIGLFEKRYAQFTEYTECVTCANGLDALYLILRGYKELGVFKDGDEIIVPANTYIATILAISRNNLTPVLVEPTFENLQIDENKIEEAITSRTKGILIVNLYGRQAYTEKIGRICKEHNLKLMEDCAQSHGLKCYGDACAWSFYPGKNLGAMGDAGAVTTDDRQLALAIRAIANYGSQKKYVFKYKGINSRMSEMDAAILQIKLKYLREDNYHRKEIALYYYDNIKTPLITLPRRLKDEDNVYHIFPIFCKNRDELQHYLTDKGIQTLIHYPIPPHKQECYKEWNQRIYPITERIHREELSLPMSQVLSKEEAEKIVEAINKFK